MGSISTVVYIYILYLFFTLVTGTVSWVKRRYSVGGVLAIIFSLFGPLLTLIIAAQKESDVKFNSYLGSQFTEGNILVIMHVFFHLILVCWTIFLIIVFIIAMKRNNWYLEQMKETIAKWRKKLTRKQSQSKQQ